VCELGLPVNVLADRSYIYATLYIVTFWSCFLQTHTHTHAYIHKYSIVLFSESRTSSFVPPKPCTSITDKEAYGHMYKTPTPTTAWSHKVRMSIIVSCVHGTNGHRRRAARPARYGLTDGRTDAQTASFQSPILRNVSAANQLQRDVSSWLSYLDSRRRALGHPAR